MIRSLVKLPSLHTSAALALALCLACGDEDGGGSDPQMMVEPQLAEGRAEALEFWWQQGQGVAGEHLVIADASSDGDLQLTVFDLPPSNGW